MNSICNGVGQTNIVLGKHSKLQVQTARSLLSDTHATYAMYWMLMGWCNTFSKRCDRVVIPFGQQNKQHVQKQNAFGTNPRLSLRWTTEFWRSEVGETNSNFIQTRDRTLCQKGRVQTFNNRLSALFKACTCIEHTHGIALDVRVLCLSPSLGIPEKPDRLRPRVYCCELVC